MMRIPKLFLLLPLLTLAACSTPQMLVDTELKNETTAVPVKGRQGWLVNQQLSFGDYTTGKVKRGWTKSYDIPFIVHFSGSKEALEFDIENADGQRAEVICLGKLREQDLPLFNQLFEVNLKWKDVFSGTIALQNGNQHYDFVAANLNQNNWFREAAGFIRYGSEQIELQPVKRLSDGKKFLGEQALGFQFVYQGNTIGAVETVNNGRVWLKPGLDEELSLVLASTAAALLLRSDLSDQPAS